MSQFLIDAEALVTSIAQAHPGLDEAATKQLITDAVTPLQNAATESDAKIAELQTVVTDALKHLQAGNTDAAASTLSGAVTDPLPAPAVDGGAA